MMMSQAKQEVKCSCYIKTDKCGCCGRKIIKCPLCKAAPEMLSYIKDHGYDFHGSHTDSSDPETMKEETCPYEACSIATKLIAKVEWGKG